MTFDRTENWWNARLCTAWCSSVRTGVLGNNKNIYHAIKPQHEMPLSVWVCMCLKGRNVFPVCLASEIDFLSLPTLLYLLSVLDLFNNVFKNDSIKKKRIFTYKYRCTNVKYQIIIHSNYFRYHTWNKNKKSMNLIIITSASKTKLRPFLEGKNIVSKNEC